MFVQPYEDRVTGVVRCWVVLSDDGVVLADGIATRQDAEDRMRGLQPVRLVKARARQVLRPLRKYIRMAARHDLTIGRENFRFFGQLTLDGMPAAEWIEAVCGCYEDGGSASVHVEESSR